MKNFFFDLDGTLTDPGLGITNSVMYSLKSYGICETNREKLYTFIGPPLVESFMEHYGFTREEGYEATRRFQEYFSQKGLFENTVYQGIPQLLSQLKETGGRIILATSKPEEFSLRILEHFDLLQYFDFVCGATMDEKTRSKKEDVLSYALKTSLSDPKESVMIGDRKFDILAGKRFGLSTVGVLYGYGDREELKKAGADEICESVEELKEYLLK
ncbi:MAG: HAD hydrolase-like protein [Clostridia bacterium]|nr:HAD hydrolase-like protein [Clostridia bacterium]